MELEVLYVFGHTSNVVRVCGGNETVVTGKVIDCMLLVQDESDL